MIADSQGAGGACGVAERPTKRRGGLQKIEPDAHPSDVRLCELSIQAESGNYEGAIAGLRQFFKERMAGHFSRHERERPRDPRDLTLAELGLCVRTINALELAQDVGSGRDRWIFPGVLLAGKLCHYSADELRQLQTIGPNAIDEIRRCLGAVRLRLRGDDLYRP